MVYTDILLQARKHLRIVLNYSVHHRTYIFNDNPFYKICQMDKASVLADAIKYVKQLQERMKILEEQAAKKTVESVVFVKRTQYSADDDISSSDENFDSCSDQPLPEIEARVSDKEVLIRIHCEKKKGCLANILREIEKLDLTIVNSSVLPFGNSTLDITIVSQVHKNSCNVIFYSSFADGINMLNVKT